MRSRGTGTRYAATGARCIPGERLFRRARYDNFCDATALRRDPRVHRAGWVLRACVEQQGLARVVESGLRARVPGARRYTRRCVARWCSPSISPLPWAPPSNTCRCLYQDRQTGGTDRSKTQTHGGWWDWQVLHRHAQLAGGWADVKRKLGQTLRAAAAPPRAGALGYRAVSPT